jgi:uncharacterized protein YggE
MAPSRGMMGMVALAGLVAGGAYLHGYTPAGASGRTAVSATSRVAPSIDRGAGRSGSCQGAGTITATGTGSATGTSDSLTMTLGVQTQSSTASAALARNNRQSRALIAALEQGGVTSPHIQTSDLNINPVYDSSGNITGYQVSDQVTATLNHLSGAGSLIDSAASKVGNDITFSGLSFSVSNTAALEAAAREHAVRAAALDAKAISGAAGVRLGPLCSASDESSAPAPIALAPGALAAKAASVPVQPGRESVTAQVTLVYRAG